jgi:hypothetical protein
MLATNPNRERRIECSEMLKAMKVESKSYSHHYQYLFSDLLPSISFSASFTPSMLEQ